LEPGKPSGAGECLRRTVKRETEGEVYVRLAGGSVQTAERERLKFPGTNRLGFIETAGTLAG